MGRLHFFRVMQYFVLTAVYIYDIIGVENEGNNVLKAPSKPERRFPYMALSEAHKKAVAKYNAANYDRVELRLDKGQKEIVKAHADTHGESLNAFINRAIREAMERDAQK